MKKLILFVLFAVSACLAFTACTPPAEPTPDEGGGTVIYNPIIMPED